MLDYWRTARSSALEIAKLTFLFTCRIVSLLVEGERVGLYINSVPVAVLRVLASGPLNKLMWFLHSSTCYTILTLLWITLLL